MAVMCLYMDVVRVPGSGRGGDAGDLPPSLLLSHTTTSSSGRDNTRRRKNQSLLPLLHLMALAHRHTHPHHITTTQANVVLFRPWSAGVAPQGTTTTTTRPTNGRGKRNTLLLLHVDLLRVCAPSTTTTTATHACDQREREREA